MNLWNKKRSRTKTKIKNLADNRIKIIMAVIFLFGLAVIGKLYYLQIMYSGYYVSLAAGQHEAERNISSSRGRIFFQDKKNTLENEKLFPVATNKEFALLYVKPSEIENNDQAEYYADMLYEVLDKTKTAEIIKNRISEENDKSIKVIKDEILKLQAEKQDTATLSKNLETFIDEYNLNSPSKIEALVNIQKENIIKNYLNILNKKSDPYEPIKKKVDINILKNVYLASAKYQGWDIAGNVEFKNNVLYYNNEAGKEKVLDLKVIGFEMESFRYYPEANLSSHIIGFLGFEGDEKKGYNGIEGYFNEELSGQAGKVKAERDAKGNLTIINNRVFENAKDGNDIILTIDHSIQFTVCQKLNAAVLRHGADGGSAIVIDPKNGAILAMCSFPDYDPNDYKNVENSNIFNNPAIFDQYEPGSIFKAITMAAGLDQNKVSPDTTFNDTGSVKIANYTIENSDHKAHGMVTMANVLELSLNTGAIYVMRKIGPPIFENYLKNFGFGEKTGIELKTESKGDIRSLNDKKNKELYSATASFGQGISVTPLQMVMAFGAVANGGILMKPYIVNKIIKPGGEEAITSSRQIRRVISERASMLLGGMLVNVVEKGHGKKAGVKGYYVAGKTGTAQIPKKDGRGYEENAHIGSFAGFAPADDPAFAMIVRIDHPRDVEWAESSAAPLFGEIAEFILNYKQIAPTRK